MSSAAILPHLRVSNDFTKFGRRADLSEGDAGDPDHGRRARRLDASAVGADKEDKIAA
jgi:hypothetical protein